MPRSLTSYETNFQKKMYDINFIEWPTSRIISLQLGSESKVVSIGSQNFTTNHGFHQINFGQDKSEVHTKVINVTIKTTRFYAAYVS